MASGQAKKNSVTETKTAEMKKQNKFRSVGRKNTVKQGDCEVCETTVEVDHKGIECEICKHWFHANCVDIEDNEYEVLTTHQKGTIHWYCDDCNVKSVEMARLVFNIQERLLKSEKETENLRNDTKAKFEKIEADYDTMKADIRTLNQKIDEGLKRCFEDSDKLVKSTQKETIDEIKEEIKEVKSSSLAEIMKQELEKSLDGMANEIETVKSTLNETKTDAAEARDRENRRNNIVIYRLHESDTNSTEDRKKHDTETCLDLICNTLEVDCHPEEIKQVTRLGQRNRETTDRSTTSRPVLIEFRSYTTKNQVMESLYKLKNANEHFRQISVTHDMTKIERSEIQKKVEEAKQKEMEETGEFIWRVRGVPGSLKLVRLRKRQ